MCACMWRTPIKPMIAYECLDCPPPFRVARLLGMDVGLSGGRSNKGNR